MLFNFKAYVPYNIKYETALEYYVDHGLGSERDFKSEIEKYGSDYVDYYYNLALEDDEVWYPADAPITEDISFR